MKLKSIINIKLYYILTVSSILLVANFYFHNLKKTKAEYKYSSLSIQWEILYKSISDDAFNNKGGVRLDHVIPNIIVGIYFYDLSISYVWEWMFLLCEYVCACVYVCFYAITCSQGFISSR